MSFSRHILLGVGFACALVACSSSDKSGLGPSAGSSGTDVGGSAAGGSSAGSSAGQAPQGGDDATAGSTSIAGSTSATGGSAGAASAGTAGASVGGDSAGTAGAAAGGDAGASSAGSGGSGTAGSAGADAGGSGGSGGSGPPPLLQNGSFEGGGLAPWQVTVTPSTVGKAIYTQWGPGGESVDGKYEVSFWNGMYAFTGDLHQTVTGLTPGKYQLTLYIAYGTGINSAYLYAIGCGAQDVQVNLPMDVDMSTFTPTSIPSIDVTEDSCTVGIYADMNLGNWLNADEFVLAPLPPS